MFYHSTDNTEVGLITSEACTLIAGLKNTCNPCNGIQGSLLAGGPRRLVLI